MKKTIFRLLAYAMDMVIISVISLGIASIPFVNPNMSKYKTDYEELNKIQTTYTKFSEEYNKYVEDSKLTKKEIEKLGKNYPEYVEYVEKYEDKELKEKDLTKINEKVNESFLKVYNKKAYKMTKYNSITKVINILVAILYLGIIQYMLKGTTIAKKVFRLRVVDNKDIEANVPLWKYVIRSIFIAEVLIIVADLVSLYSLSMNKYIVVANNINTAQYIYELAFLVVLMMREDGRSIHDLIVGTRVALFDKENNEVIDTPAEEETVEEEPKKEEKKETKTNSKKKTTTKKKTTKKEVVKAEKVND